MTIFQIIALLLGGTLSLASLAGLLSVYINKNRSWGILEAFILSFGVVLILIAFLGVQT